LTEYVEIPFLLDVHHPSLKAVVHTMARFQNGESLSLPCDLSERVRNADPPFPEALLPPGEDERRRIEDAVNRVAVEVIDLRRETTDPAKMTVRLRLDGRPRTLKLRLYAEQGAVPLMPVEIDDEPSLSFAEYHAVLHALLPRT